LQSLELSLDLSAPVVVVPDDANRPTVYMLADLGRFVMRTEVVSQANKVRMRP